MTPELKGPVHRLVTASMPAGHTKEARRGVQGVCVFEGDPSTGQSSAQALGKGLWVLTDLRVEFMDDLKGVLARETGSLEVNERPQRYRACFVVQRLRGVGRVEGNR
jgi:hypothetical protein